jgi:galactose-1-phosphate uridylyltransferase
MNRSLPRRLHWLPDGTIKQESVVTGTVAWTVPGRSHRPLPSPLPPSRPLHGDRDRVCAFCSGREVETPPERSRLVLGGEGPGVPWRIEEDLPAEQALAAVSDFRRIPNLFPILPFSYWQAAHGATIPAPALRRAAQYAATPTGRAHLLGLARTRRAAAGAGPDEVARQPEQRLLAEASEFFASTHDVIVARRHFMDGATHDDQLCASGDLSVDEHHAFIAFTVQSLQDLSGSVPDAQYVATFQNWLRPAGASFDHLHKQLVAVDEHGPLMDRVLALLHDEPDLFNVAVADPAVADGLVIAENDHALALAGVGHRYPTIELYATGPAHRPWELDADALRGVSDLLHACHAATGRLVPCNEEWHYRPIDADVAMPWRIDLKWRVSTLAGFEGGTRINVNTISPFTLRERVVRSLVDLRSSGRIGPVRIGPECSQRLGALRYAHG